MRDGLHCGVVPNASSTRSPDRASRSMFGVRIPAFPYTPTSRHPRSSATSTTMFGRACEGACEGACAPAPRVTVATSSTASTASTAAAAPAPRRTSQGVMIAIDRPPDWSPLTRGPIMASIERGRKSWAGIARFAARGARRSALGARRSARAHADRHGEGELQIDTETAPVVVLRERQRPKDPQFSTRRALQILRAPPSG